MNLIVDTHSQLTLSVVILESGTAYMPKSSANLNSSASSHSLLGFQEKTEEDMIEQERKNNLKCYNKINSELINEYLGKYAVIADGKLQQVADSFDDVKTPATNISHRFVFEIEQKTQTKRKRLRWPMNKKK